MGRVGADSLHHQTFVDAAVAANIHRDHSESEMAVKKNFAVAAAVVDQNPC